MASEALVRRGELILALALANLRARFGRGRLKLVKWLLDPFVLVGTYLIFVALLLDRPGEAPGLSLACAVVPFQVILVAVFHGLVDVSDARSIILNMSFPRTLIPVATAVTEAMGFGSSLVLIVVMMAVYGAEPTLALLWLPVVLAMTVFLAVACCYVSSLAAVWFPELRDVMRGLVRALYFVAPGVVALADIPGTANELIRINPLTGVFEAYRDLFLYGHSPQAWELLVPCAWALALLAIFLPLYGREAPHLAKVVG